MIAPAGRGVWKYHSPFHPVARFIWWLSRGILAMLLVAGPVYAHAELVAAEPGPGAVVDSSPDVIWLEFSEPLRPGSDVVIFGTGFRSVPGVRTAIDLTSPTRLVTTLPLLVPDNYTVQWTSISVDGDTRTGSYAFGVRQPPSRMPWVYGPAAFGIILLLAWVVVCLHRLHARRLDGGNALK